MSVNESLAQELNAQIATIEFPEAANESLLVTGQRIKGNILSVFAKFLANNASLLPSKEIVLKMLEDAIDLAFTAVNRPLIASIIKPAVKAWILEAAGKLYDSILTPAIEV